MTVLMIIFAFLFGLIGGMFMSRDIFNYAQGNKSYFKRVYDFILRFAEEKEINS